MILLHLFDQLNPVSPWTNQNNYTNCCNATCITKYSKEIDLYMKLFLWYFFRCSILLQSLHPMFLIFRVFLYIYIRNTSFFKFLLVGQSTVLAYHHFNFSIISWWHFRNYLFTPFFIQCQSFWIVLSSLFNSVIYCIQQ